MNIPVEVINAYEQLESDMERLNITAQQWDSLAINHSGSNRLRQIAKQVTFQAKKLESVINEHTWPSN